MLNRRGLLAGIAAAPLLAGVARAADSGPYPVETLFRAPALLDARLSPDGAKVALLLDAGRDGARDLKIEIIDAANPAVGAVRLNVGTVEARWMRWAGRTRLLLGAAEQSKLTVTDPGSRGASATLDLDYQRVLSLPLDGGDPVALFAEGRFRRVLDLAELVAVEDGSHALFAALDPGGTTGGSLNSGASMMDNFSTEMNEMAFSKVALFRTELGGGAIERIDEGEPATIRWETQGATPVLRRDLDEGGDSESWWIKPPGAPQWKRARNISVADPDLIFLGAAEAPGVVWVLGRDQPGAMRSVRQWDLASDTLAAPVSVRDGAEAASVLIDAKGRFLLAEYRGDGVSWDGLDRALIAQMKGLQSYFGASSRVRLLAREEASGRLLVTAAGPNRPLTAGLYDPGRRKVTELASAAPWLDPARLSDGSGALIGPAGGPLIVVVRPAQRDPVAHDFDPWAQAFAARGWRTLETTDAPGLEARVLAAGPPVAVVGWGPASKAAASLARVVGARAAVLMESPDADPALLGSAQVAARRDGVVEARDGALAILLLRPASARLSAGNERLVRAIFARDHIGGAAAASEAARGGADRAWTNPQAQARRCTAAADFIARNLGS